MTERTLIDVPAVAKRLGTTERHVQQLCTDRRIPHVKVGRLNRFDPQAVEEWIERNSRAEVGS